MKRKHNLPLTLVSSFCVFLLILICERNKYWQVNDVAQRLPPIHVREISQPHTNFTIKPSFSLPVHVNYTWELKKVLQSTWVSQLQLFVSDIGSLGSLRFVNLITSNFIQKNLVLNWLIAARLKVKEPLQNILVISIDNALNQLLETHGIPSIYIPPYTILKTKFIPPRHDQGFALQMVRLTVMRLLSHWGIDVVSYDPEAVILKNPHKLYNRHPDTDVLGGFAAFPPHHVDMWQAALGVGSWMVRSTQATEKFWTEVGKTIARNDQMKINIGLERMKVTPLSMEYDNLQDLRVLRGRYNFVVKIIPLSTFCRNRYCEKKMQNKYFIWNNGKEREIKQADLWFLKENWNSHSKLSGRAWLQSIASMVVATDACLPHC